MNREVNREDDGSEQTNGDAIAGTNNENTSTVRGGRQEARERQVDQRPKTRK